MTSRSYDERTSTAFHEAGHAVLAIQNRVPIRYVTIVPDEEQGTLGHVRHAGDEAHRRLRDGLEFAGLTLRQLDKLERHVQVSLAGEAAECRYADSCDPATLPADLHERIENGSESDLTKVADFATSLIYDERERDAWLWLMQVRTENEVDVVWQMIEHVAALLLGDMHLSNRRLRAEYRSVVQTTPMFKDHTPAVPITSGVLRNLLALTPAGVLQSP
jgi:ATP-dependent Zn protease